MKTEITAPLPIINLNGSTYGANQLPITLSNVSSGIPYSLQNARITNAYLSNQTIYSTASANCTVVGNGNRFSTVSTITPFPDCSFIKNGECHLHYVHAGIGEYPVKATFGDFLMTGFIDNDKSAAGITTYNNQSYWYVGNGVTLTTPEGVDRNITYKFSNNSKTGDIKVVSEGDSCNLFFQPAASYLKNYDIVPLGNSSDKNSVYLENGYIKFKGTGDLTVEIGSPAYIVYTHPDGSKKSIDLNQLGDSRALIIDPQEFKYENTLGQYRINLEIGTGVNLFDPITLENRFIFDFEENDEARSGGGNVVLRNYVADSTGNSNTDASQATVISAERIKKIYDDDLRIYVIKYKPELNYSDEKQIKNFDYSAIDSCASDSKKVYEAKNEDEFAAHLSTIAKDIKDWADYREARLVN